MGPTYQGHATWKDETTWNYEIGSKSRIMGDRGSFNVSAFYLEIRDLQATVTAGSCSSRIILGVPKSRSVGGEAELSIAPDQHFDFSVSASVSDAKIRSTVTSAPGPDGSVSVVAGIVAGSRLPSVPDFQTSAAATYRWGMGGATGHARGTYQHVGSRLTQVGDSSLAFPASLPPGTLDMTTFGANTIGGPLTQQLFRFDNVMPSYDIVNVRLGVGKGRWDVGLYANNLTDERAFLALDRERGLRARVGYLTNQPRTFGLDARVHF